jgi:acetyl-CoA C-acetyltransferase
MSLARPLGYVIGTAQVPMRTRLPDYNYADLLGRIAYQALADAEVDAKDVDGLILAMSPTTPLGIDEPQYWGITGLPGERHFLGRVHVLAASGIAAFRLGCTYVASGRKRRVLVVAADLADEVPSLTGALGQLHDPFTDKQVTRNAIISAAVQMSAYMARHKLGEEVMAEVVVKNRANGVLNEFAQLRQAITVDDVLNSPVMAWPMKRFDSSPRSSGAAAVLIGSEPVNRTRPAVYATGFGSYAGGRSIGSRMVAEDNSYLDGSDLAEAAQRAYATAGIANPADEIGLAEVYSSFGILELLSIEALRLNKGANAAELIRDGHFHRDSALPVNASGGATCGSPISSTGLIRVIEAVTQLQGEAGQRQVAVKVPRAAVSAIAGAFQTHEVGVLEAMGDVRYAIPSKRVDASEGRAAVPQKRDETPRTKARSDPEGIVFADAGWSVPQFYRPDPMIERMFEALKSKRLVGARVAGGSRVIFPPQSVCEVSFRDTDGLVDVGPGGTIRTFTIVHTKWGGLATPYIIVYVQLDGASTATGGYLRNASTDSAGSLSLIGARCRAVFKDEPAGEWSDFWFELEE